TGVPGSLQDRNVHCSVETLCWVARPSEYLRACHPTQEYTVSTEQTPIQPPHEDETMRPPRWTWPLLALTLAFATAPHAAEPPPKPADRYQYKKDHDPNRIGK